MFGLIRQKKVDVAQKYFINTITDLRHENALLEAQIKDLKKANTDCSTDYVKLQSALNRAEGTIVRLVEIINTRK